MVEEDYSMPEDPNDFVYWFIMGRRPPKTQTEEETKALLKEFFEKVYSEEEKGGNTQ